MFRLLEETGFRRVRAAAVPRFRVCKETTQKLAAAHPVKAVMMTALTTGPHVNEATPPSATLPRPMAGQEPTPRLGHDIDCQGEEQDAGPSRRARLDRGA